MAVQFSATELNQMSTGVELDQARAIVDEAIANGEVATKSGRPVKGEMGYYALRLAATGSSTHQFGGVQFGNSPDRDKEIRTAMWVLYRNTDAPDSAKRVSNTNTANRRTAVRTGSQPTTVQFRMPESHDPEEALEIAREAIDQWLEDWNAKVAEDAKRTMTSAVDNIRKLGMANKELAEHLGISEEAVAKLLEIGKVQPATEVPPTAEGDDDDDDES